MECQVGIKIVGLNGNFQVHIGTVGWYFMNLLIRPNKSNNPAEMGAGELESAGSVCKK